MILEESISIEWIEKVSALNQKADKILVEKVARALGLLECLVLSGCPFTFKGGTALMLHLGSAKRLSIDIDIITPPLTDLHPFCEYIVAHSCFTRFELNRRDAGTHIPKAHIKFYYVPTFKTSQDEDYILLDILFEQVQYAQLKRIGIDSTFIAYTTPATAVNVPSMDDLLGDKLTAFAPNTTGIPYVKNGNSKAMEIIKQLYDIGCLFNHIENLDITSRTFKSFAETEQKYRNQATNHKAVLDDVFQTALCISTRGMEGAGDFEALMKGINQIRSFIFSENFQIDKAIVAASKAAYLSVLIAKGEATLFRYQNPNEVASWLIEQPFSTKLNKLKKSNAEAFFYWYQTYLLCKFKA